MPVVEYEQTWHPRRVFGEGGVWCPVCGCETFTIIEGWGYWCEHCNTKATVRPPRSDTGYVVEFDTGYAWGDDVVEPLPDDCSKVLAKLLNLSAPGLEWWGDPYDPDTGERHAEGWSPVERGAHED